MLLSIQPGQEDVLFKKVDTGICGDATFDSQSASTGYHFIWISDHTKSDMCSLAIA